MNLQTLTSPSAKAVARWLIMPTIVMVAVGAVIIHFTSEIEAQNLKKLTEISTMERELQAVGVHIGMLEQEIAVIRTLDARYDAIVAKGFVGQPGRLHAAQLLDELKSKYGLVSLTYDVSSERAQEIAGRDGTGFRLVTNVIALEIGGLTDTQILGFMAELTERLEGQIQVDAMSIRGVAGVSDDLLHLIAAGETPAAFEAQLTIRWNNVVVTARHDDNDNDGEAVPDLAMSPVRQWQIDNGMSDEDVLRIVARDNLMLTERDAAVIDAALRIASTGAEGLPDAHAASRPVEPRDFRLDGLLYLSPTRWSLWLNGDHVTPGTVPADLRVNAITPDYVELVWMPDTAQPQDRRIFALEPNQIYLADTGEVLDMSALSLGEFSVMPEMSIKAGAPDATTGTDRIARPEELTLSAEQVGQLRRLDDALKAQD